MVRRFRGGRARARVRRGGINEYDLASAVRLHFDGDEMQTTANRILADGRSHAFDENWKPEQVSTIGWLSIASVTVESCGHHQDEAGVLVEDHGIAFNKTTDGTTALLYCPGWATVDTGRRDYQPLTGPWYLSSDCC